jgi:hypothetical protein
MKKLIVCGCSYSAPSHKTEYAGTSWSEVLAKKLGWNLENYARQGCSNGGIRIQIDEAIKQRPDFVIVTPTSYDRMEIPNFKNETKPLLDSFVDLFVTNENLHYRKSGIGYEYNAGLENINYIHNFETSRLICETIHTLTSGDYHNYRHYQIPNDIKKALEMYINYLYDSTWKHQTDIYIIRDGLVQIQANNIPFLVNPGYAIWDGVKTMREFLSNVIENKYLQDDDTKTPHWALVLYPPEGSTKKNLYGTNDPGYHTTPEGQEYLANHYYDIIKNRWGL